MIIHCFLRFVFYLVNINTSTKSEKAKKSKKLSIKLNKILAIKLVSSVFLLLLMASSLALLIVSAVVTTKPVEAKEEAGRLVGAVENCEQALIDEVELGSKSQLGIRFPAGGADTPE